MWFSELIKFIAYLLIIVYFFTVEGSTTYSGNESKGNNSGATISESDAGNEADIINEKSGQVDKLAWDGDENFIEAQKKYNANILMAAFRTVLKDPLPGEEENVHLGAKKISGTVLKPGEMFSQNKRIGPYTTQNSYRKGPTYIGSTLSTTIGGGVCKIASTLYNTAVLSNLKVVERHAHGMPVPYVPYGQDATVSYGAKDFKFVNDTNFPILIWAEGIDNVLYIAFYGAQKPPSVSWHHKVLNTVKAGKLYKRNPLLKSNEEKLILEGMDGATVKSWVNVQKNDGIVTKKYMGKSYYKPMNYIYEKR